jgi:hypothetical protein
MTRPTGDDTAGNQPTGPDMRADDLCGADILAMGAGLDLKRLPRARAFELFEDAAREVALVAQDDGDPTEAARALLDALVGYDDRHVAAHAWLVMIDLVELPEGAYGHPFFARFRTDIPNGR